MRDVRHTSAAGLALKRPRADVPQKDRHGSTTLNPEEGARPDAGQTLWQVTGSARGVGIKIAHGESRAADGRGLSRHDPCTHARWSA